MRVVAPWTPKGQYHLDLHFVTKFEVHKLDETDLRIFAHLGHRILEHYRRELTIENVNIIFIGSPLQRQMIPVIARFIPRVNMPALYEYLGVNVVDTPPTDIAAEFRKNIRWEDELRNARAYDQEKSLAEILK